MTNQEKLIALVTNPMFWLGLVVTGIVFYMAKTGAIPWTAFATTIVALSAALKVATGLENQATIAAKTAIKLAAQKPVLTGVDRAS